MQLEKIATIPVLSDQLENKVLYSNHSHDTSLSYKSTYTLKYVIEGEKRYSFDNQNIKLSKNQYLVLNNNSRIVTESKGGTKGLSFFLSSKLINEIYSYRTGDKSCPEFLEVIQNRSTNNIGFLLHETSCLYERSQSAFRQQIDSLFISISEAIVQEQLNIDNKFVALKIIKQSTKKELFKLITTAKEYLNDNIKENLSLDTVSRDIGVSKYYFHRIFTEINGSTPLEYLTAIRLEKAKNSLQNPKKPILEVAIECGFDNTAYFSNTFKRRLGLSPTQFRNSL